VKARQSFIQVLQQPKMAALLLLGFSSGLPLYLASKAPLQAWLSQEGLSLEAIAAVSLFGLPYSLKFLWSPFLDRFVPPFLGRRRGWLVITQVALIVAIAAMALQHPRAALQLLGINALVIAFLSASQDIVVDAYRTDVLEEREMGMGASLFLLGYRIAILVTGSLSLALADRLPWPVVYLLMALLMLVGLVTAFFAPEPPLRDRPPQSLFEAVERPFVDFFQRKGVFQGLMILIFIVVYRFGDALVKNLSTPFLLDKGLHFTQTDIAFPTALGIVAVIVGTLVGGAITTQIGINKSLWIFAVCQAIGNLLYFALALVGKNYGMMLAAINAENFCAGLESAAFVAFLMSLCNQRFSATQYALLSSLVAFSRDIMVAPSGKWAVSMGWPNFFLATAILALPGLVLLPFFAPWNATTSPEMVRPGMDED
jgi:MFS transporter, PAT family, beta-lactamase induction signal transducer AmpG